MRSKIAAAGLILSLSACTSPGGDTESTEAASASAQASCSTDSPLKIVEQGWSWTPGDENASRVSFAAIVKNTSDSQTVTRNGTIGVEFQDAKGKQLGTDDKPAGATFDVTELGPGDTAAVSGLGVVPEKPKTVDVTATGACLLKADAANAPTFTVSNEKFTLEGDKLEAGFTVDSSDSKRRSGRVVLVFRDSSGEIIGGGPYPGQSSQGATLEAISPGKAKRDVTVDVNEYLPDDADVDATEVFVSGILK